MASSDFIPDREPELVIWSNNFDALITASPPTYGLDIGQAAAFATLNTAWVSAYTVANNALTRSPSNIATKNTAKDAMVDNARDLAAIVRAFPGITDAQLLQLGLNVRDEEPTPVPVPSASPMLDIVSTIARTVRIRMHDPLNPNKRGKPDGVAGATVFSFVGPLPPAPSDTDQWKFEGSTTRTTLDIQFDAEIESGTTVWLTAFWYNPRAQSGPAAAPVSVQIPGTLPMAA